MVKTADKKKEDNKGTEDKEEEIKSIREERLARKLELKIVLF